MTASEGPGSRARHASPLWTLQHLRFGPDVAAAHADRGENRDPGVTAGMNQNQLTREMRLENALCLLLCNICEGRRSTRISPRTDKGQPG